MFGYAIKEGDAFTILDFNSKYIYFHRFSVYCHKNYYVNSFGYRVMEASIPIVYVVLCFYEDPRSCVCFIKRCLKSIMHY